MLKYLSYASKEAQHFSEEDLKQLVEQARANNERLEITGLLLYFDGTFTQYIEGPPAHIDALFQTITADPRHEFIVQLSCGITENRKYKEWSMGYKNYDQIEVAEILNYPNFNPDRIFRNYIPHSGNPGIILLDETRKQ
ncbi:hypothetical protein GCM10009117_12010 [Gangjinia marincola]|uniref:BLUF domain-containing protein n=1 Tax=Gangjinia marincola TaxID=578463 RepID=A0ABN1MG05_9FLAO